MEETPITLKTTADGSHTLFNAALNETYHSHHGAVTESRHVFIKEGLSRKIEEGLSEISVLEIGFGTGLNAILSVEQALAFPEIRINYVGLEPFPVDAELIEKLNYSQFLDDRLHVYFAEMHRGEWGVNGAILPNFSLLKSQSGIEHFNETAAFDLVYFDAFAPKKQEEMWSVENLQRMFDCLKPNGLLATYCAKGQFKRDLKSVGFQVTNPSGPPGKREMTVGRKP